MTILKSASKTVFLLMTVAVIALTLLSKVDPKDFIALASMCFAFYFTRDRGEVK